ncbi:MAG: HAMP domain-containing histidine kinase [Rhizobiaceae bacterium]|nr:HAMP domain-containing histidine kinase [Rhizobiaceae bacterium]
MKRRLYLQIYVTIIASLVLVVILSGLMWSFFGRDQFNRGMVETIGQLTQLTLSPTGAPLDDQVKAVERLGKQLDIDVSLYDTQRRFIAGFGDKIYPTNEMPKKRRWWHGRGEHRGQVWRIPLPDGRWLVAKTDRPDRHRPLLNFALYLAQIALVVGLVAYPFVRRLTGRLERLQKGVERIGSGDLSARIEVKGRDEVAALAQSFNEAAEKIESLVSAHRMLLANASHELRTPLSRIRLGCEMLKDGPNPARSEAIEQDIAELDTLIDEILLMSRLDSGNHADMSEGVDLVALTAEECARYDDCSFSGNGPEIHGDARLLQRLIRNMLDNAYKHGTLPVSITLFAMEGMLKLTVSDEGNGIAEDAREKVFQPFYRASDKQNIKGFGLGLPLIRQIAEAHGGTAEILPKAEHRSAIQVTLPIS